MNRQDFWNIIEHVDRASLLAGDDDAAIAPLERHLGTLTPDELESYEEHLSQCLYALDGQIYADQSGESGDSDDAFLYARCYIVGQGQQHYEAALRDPSLMPKTLDGWFEALLYPHRRAWATIRDTDASKWAFHSSVSYESGSNEQQWPR